MRGTDCDLKNALFYVIKCRLTWKSSSFLTTLLCPIEGSAKSGFVRFNGTGGFGGGSKKYLRNFSTNSGSSIATPGPFRLPTAREKKNGTNDTKTNLPLTFP